MSAVGVFTAAVSVCRKRSDIERQLKQEMEDNEEKMRREFKDKREALKKEVKKFKDTLSFDLKTVKDKSFASLDELFLQCFKENQN